MNLLETGIAIDKPAHDPAPTRKRPCRVLHQWPVGTFVENLAFDADGDLLVAVHSTQTLERCGPEGGAEVVATLPGPVAGLAVVDGHVFVNVSTPGVAPGAIYRVSGRGGRRSVEPWVTVEGALFLNGAAPFLGGDLLVGDAIRGRIYRVDTRARSASVWLEAPELKKVTDQPWMPGVNGLKVFDRHVYFSNTDASTIGRIAFDERGQPGAVERVAERLTCDDFAFDVEGNLYATTHIQNSLLRLSPAGERVILADAADGLAGCTAIAFGAGAHARAAFVTTTGGILAPAEGRVREAKLVRVEVGTAGAPLAPAGGR
jgi:SMP-30/Gluconolactonase/LRE-like region